MGSGWVAVNGEERVERPEDACAQQLAAKRSICLKLGVPLLLCGSAVGWVAVALLFAWMLIEVTDRGLTVFRNHADWLEARRGRARAR